MKDFLHEYRVFAQIVREIFLTTDKIQVEKTSVLERSLGTYVRSSNPPATDLLFELARNVSSLSGGRRRASLRGPRGDNVGTRDLPLVQP